jgi:hypothetical protein
MRGALDVQIVDNCFHGWFLRANLITPSNPTWNETGSRAEGVRPVRRSGRLAGLKFASRPLFRARRSGCRSRRRSAALVTVPAGKIGRQGRCPGTRAVRCPEWSNVGCIRPEPGSDQVRISRAFLHGLNRACVGFRPVGAGFTPDAKTRLTPWIWLREGTPVRGLC